MFTLHLWAKDEEELAANENVKITQHGARCSLTIVCTEGEDSGIYTCFAHSDRGYASCQAELTVEEGEMGGAFPTTDSHCSLCIKHNHFLVNLCGFQHLC